MIGMKHSDWIPFSSERALFAREMDAYYGSPALDISGWLRDLGAAGARCPDESPFKKKILGYRLIAERCPVHVFRHCPFYFELNTGRPRTDLGYGGLGCWMKQQPAAQAIRDEAARWWQPCNAAGLSEGWLVTDDNHHTMDYGKVLTSGCNGIIREIEAQRPLASSASERDFLDAAIEGHKAVIRVAERFAAEAARAAAREETPAIRARLERLASSAARAPAMPAASFYEALNTLLFMCYMMPALESSGLSTFGRVDCLLEPYYRRDIESGRIAPEEARDLLARFLAISDVRFGMRTADGRHVGTNGTIVLGGCDGDGTPVFNDLTRMILDLHRELRLVDPKINARVSPDHPTEYIDCLARFAAGGGNALAVFNDTVIIAANVKAGKALEDSRRYVGGGCQENVIEDCEINSRASIYLNAVQVFGMGFSPARWRFFTERERFTPRVYADCATFDAFYAAFLENLKTVVGLHIDQRNRTECRSREYNPCPFHSSVLKDCVRRRRDMMEGGCRYSPGSVSLVGIGTLIDSLYAVKIAVYERRMLTLNDLRRMLDTDFEGEAVMRGVLEHRIAKFGQEDEAIRAFSARVFADVARASSGRANTRGGSYEASLFSFRSFAALAGATGATPDGRRAGELLSAGMSPSLLALGQESSVGQVLAALEPLDLTLYPVIAVLDVKLPAVRGRLPPDALAPVIRRFMEVGGSVLQMNVVDQRLLEEARAHPERHPDLVVRVSGYSSYFNVLHPSIQDEIVCRTVADAGRLGSVNQ